MSSTTEKSISKGKLIRRIIIISAVAAALVVLCALYMKRAYYFKSHFFKGTEINQIDCSYLTVKEAEKLIAEKAEEYTLTLTFRGDETTTLAKDDMDYHYVSDGSIQKLMDSQNPITWITGNFTKNVEAAEASTAIDKSTLEKTLDSLSEMQDANMTAPQNAKVEYKDGSFVVTPEVQGNTLDKEKVISAVEKAISEGDSTLDLDSTDGIYAAPTVLSDDATLKSQADQLNELVKSSITYTLPTGTQVLDGNTLKDWLVVDANGNYTKDEDTWNAHIAQYVSDMANAVDTVNKDKQFNATGLGMITVPAATYGWEIDQDAEIAQLTQDLNTGTVTTRSPAYSHQVGANADDNYGFGGNYVEIDLSRQHLWVYQNYQVAFETDIVSGEMSAAHYTPPGTYYLYGKESPSTLKGDQLPDGSYTYQTVVQYWMPFTTSGIGMHDASWKSVFGGDEYIYNGSHGCINLSVDDAPIIYGLVEQYEPIICYYSAGYELH